MKSPGDLASTALRLSQTNALRTAFNRLVICFQFMVHEKMMRNIIC